MRQSLGTIREFRTANFHVIADAIEEEYPDLSWDETGETREALERGTLIMFVARVRVMLHGEEIGSDYLGGCVYESLESFMDHRECGRQMRELRAQGSTAVCGSYFANMIHEAISDARKRLTAIQGVRVRHPKTA